MSQADYQISDAQNGPQFVAELNSTLGATQTKNSGSSAPTSTYAFMWWADTQNGLLKMRNAANTAWETIGNTGQPNFGILTKALNNQYLARIVLPAVTFKTEGWQNLSPEMATFSDLSPLVNAQNTYVAPIAGWYEMSLSIRAQAEGSNTANNAAVSFINTTDDRNLFAQGAPAANAAFAVRSTGRYYLTQGQAAPLFIYLGAANYFVPYADLIIRFAGLTI